MTTHLISIGIATFNAIKSIESCIKSALSQTYHPLEIVIVDDFSTDGTYEKVSQLASNHEEIRIFRNNRNYGVGYVRNKIINESNGDFLAFFDDDDISVKDRLELQYKRIIEYEKNYSQSKLVICHSTRKVKYPNGTIRNEMTLGTRLYSNLHQVY